MAIFRCRSDEGIRVSDVSAVVCPTEILAFNAALPKFAALNTELIMVSTDSEFTHLAWSQTPRKEGGLGPDLKLRLVRYLRYFTAIALIYSPSSLTATTPCPRPTTFSSPRRASPFVALSSLTVTVLFVLPPSTTFPLAVPSRKLFVSSRLSSKSLFTSFGRR